MHFNHEACYKAVKSKDARFDGLFFTAVKTTGIYCRPVCKVPAPKSENCHFYKSAYEAEAAGYRPCLRCRPEMAPGFSEFNQRGELIKLILSYFEKHHYETDLIEKSAKYFGITQRHITRIFKSELGVSPMQYMMSKRLLTAKTLLHDTNLPITEIAFQSGFGSISRFNEAFKNNYNLSPSNLRKRGRIKQKTESMVFKLAYRPPYDWDTFFDYIKKRAIPHIELVTGRSYRRTLCIHVGDKIYKGWLEAIPYENEYYVSVKLSASLLPAATEVLKCVKRFFDLDAVPHLMSENLPTGIRLPGAFDGFEMSVRAILGQQITVKAATTLAGRFAQAIGDEIKTPWEAMNRLFPTPRKVLSLKEQAENLLGELGIVRARTQAIMSLSKAIDENIITFDHLLSIDALILSLQEIKGIGEWTAMYIAMRALSYPDIFLISDLGVKQAFLKAVKQDGQNQLTFENLTKYEEDKRYRTSAAIFAEKYRPWRSYLTFAIWNGWWDDDLLL